MATRSLSAALLLSFAATAVEPQAPSPPEPGAPGHWSLATGETVSPGRDAIGFGFGWPGVRFDYLHGLSDRSDVGFQLDLLYGFENTDTTKFGFAFGVPLRLVAYRKDKLLLGLHIDPGVRVYTDSNSTEFFIRFPVGGIIGIQATPEVRIAAAFDLAMALQIPNTTYFELAPQFGFGVEYLVDKNLQIGLNARFGPEFTTISGSGSRFAFTTEVLIGYRL